MSVDQQPQPISALLQSGIRFFQHLTPAPPTACLTVSPALDLPRRRYELSTFHVIDDCLVT